MTTARTTILMPAGFLLIVAVAAGVFGKPSPRRSHEVATPPAAVDAADADPIAGIGEVIGGQVISGTVEARSANALDARRQVDDEIASLRNLATAPGGRLTLGDSRYLRLKRGEGGSRRTGDGFLIIQQVEIELPRSAKREQLEAELARTRFAGPG